MACRYRIIYKVACFIMSTIILSSSPLASSEQPAVNDKVLEALKLDTKTFSPSAQKVVNESLVEYSYDTASILYNNKGYAPTIFLNETLRLLEVYINDQKEINLSEEYKSDKPSTETDNSLNDKKDTRVEVVYDGSENFDTLKPIKIEDIRKVVEDIDGKPIEMEYVKNQLIFYTRDGVPFSEVKEMLKKYDGMIVGYIPYIDFYQVEFTESTGEQLLEKIDVIKQEDIVEDDGVFLNYIMRHTMEVD